MKLSTQLRYAEILGLLLDGWEPKDIVKKLRLLSVHVVYKAKYRYKRARLSKIGQIQKLNA